MYQDFFLLSFNVSWVFVLVFSTIAYGSFNCMRPFVIFSVTRYKNLVEPEEKNKGLWMSIQAFPKNEKILQPSIVHHWNRIFRTMIQTNSDNFSYNEYFQHIPPGNLHKKSQLLEVSSMSLPLFLSLSVHSQFTACHFNKTYLLVGLVVIV